MARYIHCEDCNMRMEASAKKYDEFYESIEGIAVKTMYCDGGCGKGGASLIEKGEKCFAGVLLPDKSHPNYFAQDPKVWSHEFVTVKSE